MDSKDILCVMVAYLLGGICTGYYLVRFLRNADIREFGSGGVGARNVGRVLGRAGFVITLLGDAFKGILAIALSRHFELSEPAVSLALVAVIAGHVWPAPLGFRGGRGIATALGAYLAYDHSLFVSLAVLTVVLMVFRRGFILSGLAAFLLLPLVAGAFQMPNHVIAAVFGVSVVIIFAHRERIRNAFRDMLPAKEA